jgi:large subunit ribosomal protein L10
MVATWKKEQVKKISKKLKGVNTVGVVSIKGLPSRQLQEMRKTLRGKADLYVVKRKVLEHSFNKVGLNELKEYLQGSVGIITSDLNPFQLEKMVYGCRSTAPAKPGWIASHDIIVPEGDTGLPPGPVIGDLQNAGIKAKIQGGKIIVQSDSVVIKAGESVSRAAATALIRLKIKPVEIGLDLKAVCENGVVYPYEILHIDEAESVARLQTAHARAFNLAYNAGWFTKETVRLLIQDAFSRARNLAFNAEVINKDTVEHFLAKADAQAKALKAVLPEDLKPPAEPKGDGKPVEEGKEEASEEKKEEAAGKPVEKEEKKKAPAKEEAKPVEKKGGKPTKQKRKKREKETKPSGGEGKESKPAAAEDD